jgi:hypothetical protein
VNNACNALNYFTLNNTLDWQGHFCAVDRRGEAVLLLGQETGGEWQAGARIFRYKRRPELRVGVQCISFCYVWGKNTHQLGWHSELKPGAFSGSRGGDRPYQEDGSTLCPAAHGSYRGRPCAANAPIQASVLLELRARRCVRFQPCRQSTPY